MRRKEKEKMSTQLKIKAPKAPLKGKGFKREAFSFKAGKHSDALREAFYEMLPPEHRTEACQARRNKGYFSFGRYITPEAMAVFHKAVRDEAEMIGMVDRPQPIQTSQSKQARAPVPMPNFATIEGAEAKARAWAGLPEDQKHPAPAEIMELKEASGLGWAGFDKWARGLSAAK